MLLVVGQPFLDIFGACYYLLENWSFLNHVKIKLYSYTPFPFFLAFARFFTLLFAFIACFSCLFTLYPFREKAFSLQI